MSDTEDVNYAIIRLARAHRHRAGCSWAGWGCTQARRWS